MYTALKRRLQTAERLNVCLETFGFLGTAECERLKVESNKALVNKEYKFLKKISSKHVQYLRSNTIVSVETYVSIEK